MGLHSRGVLPIQRSETLPLYYYVADWRSANKISEASLTLGGYDISRFEPNNASFPLSWNSTRDIVISLDSITSTIVPGPLLSEPIFLSIDSSVSHLWLPKEVCEVFVQTFGLTYDEKLDLYVVNDSVHRDLQSRRPNITFAFGNGLESDDDISIINLPYSAFDLAFTANYPGDSPSTTHYFPIRHTSNPERYTLGRTFLQEAYLIVDYDRSNFSVHQALFPEKNASADYRLILEPEGIDRRLTSCLMELAIFVLALTYCLFLIVLFRHYCREKRRIPLQSHAYTFSRSHDRVSSYAANIGTWRSKAAPRDFIQHKSIFEVPEDSSRYSPSRWIWSIPTSIEGIRPLLPLECFESGCYIQMGL